MELKTRNTRDAIHNRGSLPDQESAILIPCPDYLNAVRQVLGIIDLDVCSSAQAQKSIDAMNWFPADCAEAALAEPWFGRVFFQPHPNALIARYQLQKILRDYLADRINQAVLHLRNADWLRQEPLLMSFPFLFHYRRLNHYRFDPDQGIQVRHSPSFNSLTVYLTPKIGAHFDENALAKFIEVFSPFGRVILAEDLGDEWQQQALLSTRRMPIKPLLTETRIDRY